MDRRSHESPMDFEWQTQPPADITSPFYQLLQKQGQRRGFDSPTKSTLPQADTKSFSFNSSANPATPFRNPSFTTPRKPFEPELFSEASGVESSPADNADAEDTPETIKTNTEMTAFTGGFSHRKPLFGRYGGNFLGNSPGRGEVRRSKHAETAIQKVRKRKRIERDHALTSGRRGSSDLESDSVDSKPRKSRAQSDSSSSQHWLASILSFIESKPSLPMTLSYYAQLVLTYFLVGLLIYVVWCVFLTIRADIDKESEAQIGAIRAEMALCANQYVQNRCGPSTRLPALESVCESWEMCMNRDANHLGRARVSAHTFAVIFNSFVEPISYKTMAFFFLIIFACFGVNNLAFGVFRSKVSHPPAAPHYYAPPPATPSHAQEYHWPVPQTPHQPFLNQGLYVGGEMDTRFQAIMPSQTPGQRSPKKGEWN